MPDSFAGRPTLAATASPTEAPQPTAASAPTLEAPETQPVATVKNVDITTEDFQKRVKFTRAPIISEINQLQAQPTQVEADPQ